LKNGILARVGFESAHWFVPGSGAADGLNISDCFNTVLVTNPGDPGLCDDLPIPTLKAAGLQEGKMGAPEVSLCDDEGNSAAKPTEAVCASGQEKMAEIRNNLLAL
jgi:hypothetical protein